MSLVQIAGLAWGVVEDQAGNVRSGLPVSISFASDNSPATVYDTVGGANVVSPVVTNELGQIPGFIQQGSYIVNVGGQTVYGEAITATNPQSGTASEPGTSVCVTQVSTLVLPSNPARLELVVCNDSSSGTIYLSLSDEATLGAGIVLAPNGTCYATRSYTGIVSAISDQSSTYVTIAEV